MKTALYSVATAVSLALSVGSFAYAQHYTQVNLVANTSGIAPVTDPNLVNPWGISRTSGSPWWISDNGKGLSTLYNGAGVINPLVVTIPKSDPCRSNWRLLQPSWDRHAQIKLAFLRQIALAKNLQVGPRPIEQRLRRG